MNKDEIESSYKNESDTARAERREKRGYYQLKERINGNEAIRQPFFSALIFMKG
ncbi:hypothetical protein J2TS4_19860 [Paenibacillus sp. J2TS4]|nr:hypothetical protein J2TS4_19860 [Paenibacillus sp. J2TS4]